MKKLNREVYGKYVERPEKIIQFGEGNFLRAFIDTFFHKMNEKGLFDGSVVVVQPIAEGRADSLNEQEGLYTAHLRGVSGGKVCEERFVSASISRALNPYTQYDEYLKLARNPEMRYIISNTTEAGIEFLSGDRFEDRPPKAFPAKLTVLLYERFKCFDGDETKGFLIMPCELNDNNGDKLKSCVLQYAELWNLGEDFGIWLNTANTFANTLVDRIVTGFPSADIENFTKQVGYKDDLYVTGELFHLWVIEADEKYGAELPFTEAGINVIWTDDVEPYKTRKVRILNGAHTMMTPLAMLCGLDTVKGCMDDKDILNYIKQGLNREIIPTMTLPRAELDDFAEKVLERFANPTIQHKLASISLNSVAKFKVRVLPSLLDSIVNTKQLPVLLTFSLAALIEFYKNGTPSDDEEIISYMRHSSPSDILENVKLWDANLLALKGNVEGHLDDIRTIGIRKALRKVL